MKCHWRARFHSEPSGESSARFFSIRDPPRLPTWQSLRHIWAEHAYFFAPSCATPMSVSSGAAGSRGRLHSQLSASRLAVLSGLCLLKSTSSTLRRRVHGAWPAWWTRGGVELSCVFNVSYHVSFVESACMQLWRGALRTSFNHTVGSNILYGCRISECCGEWTVFHD